MRRVLSASTKTFASLALAGFVAATSLSSSAQAQDLLPDDNGLWTYHQSPRWRESEAHPLRVAAYIVHPIGWVLREGIFRPISYLAGSTRFTRSFFGFREPYDYRQPLCFSGSEDVPDCHSIPPYASAGSAVEDDAADAEEVAVEEQKVVFPDIAFEFDKSTLNALGKARVRQVSQQLASMPTVNVVVEGHTDIVGSDDYNMKLGTRRAEAVIKELTDLGIERSRMSAVSYGESRPLFAEDTDWARAANRRAQFAVQGAAVATEVAPTTPASTETIPAAAQ